MSHDPSLLKVPFIPRNKIQDEVERFRKLYVPENELPIDILRIAEFEIGLELRPISKLRTFADVDAALLNRSVIAIDLDCFVDDRFQNRLRFSVAHELGHFWLHEKTFSQVSFATVEDWGNYVNGIPENIYSALEFQAHEFAGRLLMPSNHLESKVDVLWSQAADEFKKLGMDAGKNQDLILSHIAEQVGKHFGVSGDAAMIRIKSEAKSTRRKN